MNYIFTYSLSVGNEVSTHVFTHDCDTFSTALSALAAHLVAESAFVDKVVFNTYYKANRDYRKFREREAFEILFNGLTNKRSVV